MPTGTCHALSLALVALCILAAPAQAQVLRCTDARTGAVSYTDSSCATGLKAEQVQPARSAEALALEREQAAQAIARKEQRLREEAATAALNPPPAPAPVPAPAESPRCVQSRQQLQALLARPGRDASAYGQQLAAAQQQVELDCLGPQAYRELEQSRARSALPAAPAIVLPPLRPGRPLPPPLQPPRPEMAHCNVFRCYDRQGNVYPR